MMDWDKYLGQISLTWMRILGNFSPTLNPADKQVKGYMYDGEDVGKTYLDSKELRLLADACIKSADWLDKRANNETEDFNGEIEKRLFDSQWMNIVNHDNCWNGFTKEEAVHAAVKMAEEKMAENISLGKWPNKRV